MTHFKNSCLLLLLLVSGSLSGQIITTYAGTGTQGYSGDEGLATDASLNFPCGVAADRNGNILVADFWNARIRCVNHITGIITTIAGNGSFVNTGNGGPATAAGINSPTGVATDKWGNMYITCDSITDAGTMYYTEQGSFVRKINTAGIITTIAGTGWAADAGDGGPATAAGIGQTNSIAVDTSGNLYICEVGSRIRKINTSGVITTLAGTGTYGYSGDGGPATAAAIYSAGALVPDNKGNLYFTDGRRIRKIDAAGIIHTIAGTDSFGYTGDGGPATDARISTYGLAIDRDGNLYFSDLIYAVIRKVSKAGIITTVGGNGIRGYSGDGGPPDSAEINIVYGVAVDTLGNIYLADVQNENIRMICPACSGLSAPEVVRPQPELRVWPLPGYGRFSLLFNTSDTDPAMVAVTDLSGKKILETACIPGRELQISVNVPPGIYLVNCTNGAHKMSKKIVVK